MVKLLFVVGCIIIVQGFVFILSLAACYINLDWSYLNPINWYEGCRSLNALVLIVTLVGSFCTSVKVDL